MEGYFQYDGGIFSVWRRDISSTAKGYLQYGGEIYSVRWRDVNALLFLFSNNRINVKGAVRLSIAVAVNTGLQVLKVDFMIIDFLTYYCSWYKNA